MNRFLVILTLLALIPCTAFAQRVSQLPSMDTSNGQIAAVVNDNVITTYDINARIKLAMLSSNLPDTPEVRQKLTPQVLRGLIDEQLQMQEAKRIDVSVSQDEINQALQRINSENKVPGGDVKAFVKSQGASVEALEQQIRAGLSWQKTVTRELRPRVDVGDDEVDAVVQRIRANAGKEEYLVSEIVLPVDNPKDEDQVRALADKLVQTLKSGANFAAVARQFSQGTGAATGGDIGWIQEGQLSPELDHVLLATPEGQIADPVRSANGFHILGIRQKRTLAVSDTSQIKLQLQQAFRPFDSTTDINTITQEAVRLRAVVNGCGNLQSTLNERFPGWKWNDLGEIALAKAPTPIAEKVRGLSVGQGSDPIPTDKGALILFVCKKEAPADADINREAIMNTIGGEKLELQARRLQRDLRRNAYIDIRIGA